MLILFIDNNSLDIARPQLKYKIYIEVHVTERVLK